MLYVNTLSDNLTALFTFLKEMQETRQIPETSFLYKLDNIMKAEIKVISLIDGKYHSVVH